MKQPYTIAAYIPNTESKPTDFLTDLQLQTAAHACGVGENLQIHIRTIPVLEIQFTAPHDPIAPEYPALSAQNAMLKLLTAEIRKRWPKHNQPKFRLYQATP